MTCNLDLESLISDNNRSIATLAITTLLKTGAESSIERLMKQIATFVNEITDEFKIVVVNAIKSLCLKFPQKNVLLVNFLSTMLRDEGGLAYKTCITDTIMEIINENPEVKDSALSHLCEFIEDCEHTNLAVRVIHFIGMEGPQTSNPAQYIRYIYNRYITQSLIIRTNLTQILPMIFFRVILENAEIRSAAVSALAKFGALCDELLPNILVLLTRCQMDADDEVRDRATYYKCVLEQKNPNQTSDFLLDGIYYLFPNTYKFIKQFWFHSECAHLPHFRVARFTTPFGKSTS